MKKRLIKFIYYLSESPAFAYMFGALMLIMILYSVYLHDRYY